MPMLNNNRAAKMPLTAVSIGSFGLRFDMEPVSFPRVSSSILNHPIVNDLLPTSETWLKLKRNDYFFP